MYFMEKLLHSDSVSALQVDQMRRLGASADWSREQLGAP